MSAGKSAQATVNIILKNKNNTHICYIGRIANESFFNSNSAIFFTRYGRKDVVLRCINLNSKITCDTLK